MTLLSTLSPEGTVSEQVHVLRGLAGRSEPAQMDHLHESKVDLMVWCRSDCTVRDLLMTKCSCFALAAADMKPV
jgi:hypothetical protein